MIKKPLIAYIGLGSNTRDANLKLGKAVEMIANLNEVKVLDQSPVFYTEPQDYKKQPWFQNMCIKLSIARDIPATAFLHDLLQIELKLGRVRDIECRFGPREIDIDLLIYGDHDFDHPSCILPHPRMHKRAFVLFPLYLIDSAIKVKDKYLSYWLARIDWRLAESRIYQQ